MKDFENSSIYWRIWLLIKGITKAIENEIKEQSGAFLGILLGTLGVSL